MSTFSRWVASFVERELLFNIGQKPKLNARFEAKILSKNDLRFSENASVCNRKARLRYPYIDFTYSLHVSNSQKKNGDRNCSHE